MFTNVKSLIFRANFGLTLILCLLISAEFFPILCQSKKIAIIPNTTIGGKFDRRHLELITSLLSTEADSNVAIIIGELNKENFYEGLAQIQPALENLKIPFKMIDGFPNEISETDEEFVLVNNDRMILGINSKVRNFPDNGFIKAETLNSISEETDFTKIKNVFIISNQSLNRIQNITYLFDLLKDKTVVWIHYLDKKFSMQVNHINNVIEISLPSTFTNESLGYYVLEEKSDSLFLINKNLINISKDFQLALALKDIKPINISNDIFTIDTSLNKVFEKDYKSSSKTLSIASNNRVYTLLNNGLLYLNDIKGNKIFITELIGRIDNNPILYKDLLLISTVEGDLYSINSNNGEILQVVGIGESITSNLSVIELESAKTKIIGVVLGTSEGNIFCYDAFTFELLWEKNISKSPIVSKPLIEKDKIIFLNSNSSLYCVNSKSGSLIWKYESSDKQNFSPKDFPVSDGKNIFSLTSDGNLIAVDLMLGKRAWSTNTKGVLNQFYISSDKQKLFLIDDKGLMTIYIAKNGKEIDKIDFKKSELFSCIIVENLENTLVGFSDGSLYTFDSKFFSRELISPTEIPITSINVINNYEFIVKDINGKITFYKIN